jgi:hypothetical protein
MYTSGALEALKNVCVFSHKEEVEKKVKSDLKQRRRRTRK